MADSVLSNRTSGFECPFCNSLLVDHSWGGLMQFLGGIPVLYFTFSIIVAIDMAEPKKLATYSLLFTGSVLAFIACRIASPLKVKKP
jgi:hypothetical protein